MANSKPLLAKLTRPRLHRTIARPRLFALLDAQQDHAITWITGPPGAGKTSLVASYLATRRLPGIWFQVDAADRHPATFFFYLREAALSCVHGKGAARLPLFTPEFEADPVGFAQNWFRELFARLPDKAVLVLDNYQEAGAGTVLHRIVERAAQERPERIRLIIISLTEPPPELVRLVANEKLAVIGWEQLRLTLAETAEIAMTRHSLDNESLQLLQRQSDGWVAGLMLMLERIGHASVASESFAPEATEAVFNYFAGLVFDQAPAPMRDFLMRSAFLPNMTVETASRISGRSNAASILDLLYRRHMFTERRSGAEITYQYHALFREFLLYRARQVYRPATCKRLAAQAGRVLEERGQIEQAVALYSLANEGEALVRLICEHADSLLSQGRHRTLEDWICLTDESVRKRAPWLTYWLGAARMPFTSDNARAAFKDAFRCFRQEHDVVGSLMCAAAVIETFFLERAEDLHPADEWIDAFEDALEIPHALPSLEARLVPCLQGIIFRRPDHPKLPQWVERAWHLLSTMSGIEQRLRTGAVLLMHHVWQGDFPKAALLLRTVEQSPVEADVAPLPLICWRLQQARYHWSTGSPAEALSLLDAALVIARESGVHAMDRYIHAQRAYACLAGRQFDAAEHSLNVMESLLQTGAGPDTALFNFLKSGRHLLDGDLDAAVQYGERSLTAALACGMPVGAALCRNALAQSLICTGQCAAAQTHLDEMLKIAKDMRSPLFEHAGLLLSAYCRLQSGDTQSALDPLRRGLSIGCTHQFCFIHPWARPEAMQRLLALALKNGIECEYVRAFIRRERLLPESPDVDPWPWAIRVNTFGGLTVFVDDEPLRFNGKPQRKPLELLEAIIAHPGRHAPKVTLIDQLWPALEGDSGQNAFELALHRLRKLVGRDDAVVMQDGCVTLDAKQFRVDTWNFARLCQKVEQATSPNTDATGWAQLADELLLLYSGEFLHGEDTPWVIAARARFQSQFTRAIASVGLELQRLRNWPALTSLSRRAVENDPLNEEFHRSLIFSLSEQGRIAEALDAYRHCRQILSVTLGIEPSASTQNLYQSVRTR
ncbi:BTAD domain-containing putative transcriptional regulator [Paraburkholderia kirstenboschensis]|uniref:BTAD domain-containing putative transcriptional regulator n=1 Tax=Paraburkholderia kirstenboschensis TaxID=1245436 RepID=UPI000AC210C9|nr:BTAD domain-containing putative transcriptional regulator [Paraburkholderia kirstenboschensis]